MLNITSSAKKQLKSLIKSNQIIKLVIQNKGCSGFVFELKYDDKKSEFDEIIKLDDDKFLYIDSLAVMHAMGTTMDYHTDFFKSKFIFTNPDKTICGCGESFSK